MKLKDEADVGISEVGKRRRRKAGHIGVGNRQRAFVGTIERAHDLQERSLTRSRRTYDTHHLTFLDVEIYAFEHFEVAKGFMDISKRYHVEVVSFQAS